MLDDMDRLRATPGNLYNFHPGSHTGQGAENGIAQIADALKQILPAAKASCTTILLETMAGKGSEIGGQFEELAEIIARVPDNETLGVCLDTCHIHDGGYAIAQDPDSVVREFDHIIGLDRLKAIHINDSMNPPGNRKDRHEKIGHGHIGIEGFRRILHHPTLRYKPYYLETPCDLDGYAREIALLKSLREN
jgi:deoxyribonuclease-4